MGQHKTNPTAIKAKNGELPPKPPAMGKAEYKRWLQAAVHEALSSPFTELIKYQVEMAEAGRCYK